jgi:hypothetical protein
VKKYGGVPRTVSFPKTPGPRQVQMSRRVAVGRPPTVDTVRAGI